MLHQLHEDKPYAWMTPVEIFAPYFSEALARYMVSEFEKNADESNLRVFEVGGGTGNNALHVLNFLEANHPSIYQGMHYTLIEISPTLVSLFLFHHTETNNHNKNTSTRPALRAKS
jgi:SAM-dependent MidA family methyltransferase